MLCRDLAAVSAVGFLLAGGVPVRDVDALDTPLLPICLVGLLVGERTPPSPLLAPGVGLLGSVLSLLLGAPTILCLFSPVTPPFAALPFAVPAAAALGFASCTTLLTPLCRRNMPYPGRHWK